MEDQTNCTGSSLLSDQVLLGENCCSRPRSRQFLVRKSGGGSGLSILLLDRHRAREARSLTHESLTKVLAEAHEGCCLLCHNVSALSQDKSHMASLTLLTKMFTKTWQHVTKIAPPKKGDWHMSAMFLFVSLPQTLRLQRSYF